MATFSRRAVLEWDGDVMDGAGAVTAGTRAFAVPATFPSTAGEVRIQSSHLSGEVDAPEGVDPAHLQELAQETRERCTISIALEGTVAITYEIIAL
jgi:organic hydroperoxide reductase OsmC/OhrA